MKGIRNVWIAPHLMNVASVFSFTYGVNSGSNGAPAYGHRESRDGGLTSGSYYVHLPDGKKQKVEYIVDEKGGFNAQVRIVATIDLS